MDKIPSIDKVSDFIEQNPFIKDSHISNDQIIKIEFKKLYMVKDAKF